MEQQAASEHIRVTEVNAISALGEVPGRAELERLSRTADGTSYRKVVASNDISKFTAGAELTLCELRRDITAAGGATFAARVGKHDDFVLATALALWGLPAPEFWTSLIKLTGSF